MKQNTSLCNQLPTFWYWFLLDTSDSKKLGKYGRKEKRLW